MAIQKREYELSVWHEYLDSDNIKQEEKMAIIGAHDMTYLGRATNVKLQTKINGTHTLTFQMPDKWFDSEIGDFVQNEFKDYVSNENKVKLYYKDQWLEFFVKNVKMNKHYKSYMYEYSCSDAFIDELSRNGYGLIFDTELYNNVEEIGTFTEDILEDSYWGYAPKNNWGDFTEYTEERLFKIPVSCFKGNIKGYKLNFITTSENKIINKFTGESRQLELGDDLAREEKWFWDCYDNTRIPLLKDQIDVPNDGYIYVPYSQLNFCYITTNDDMALTATEEPATGTINNLESLLITPPSIDPSKLIQFIAIPESAEVEVDEAGLIVNKNYSYVMTVEDWNNFVIGKYWYSDCAKKDDTGYKFKKVITKVKPNPVSLYNKAVVYDGYLDSIGSLEVETGKKIAISDRTEINISEEIDQYVTVYNNKSEDYEGLYTTDENWDDVAPKGYRVCSKTATRQIIPQLARNYFENGVNIQNTSGWEVMETKEVVPGTEDASCQVKLEWTVTQGEEGQEEIKETKLNYMHSAGGKNTYPQNIIINFGAVGQNKKIEKGKVYCFGLITDKNVPIIESWDHKSFFMVGKGSINSNGNYEIEGTELSEDETDYTIHKDKVIYKELQHTDNQFYIFKSDIDIENPYLCLYFNMEGDSSEDERTIGIKEVWFFEAYTKGEDQFNDSDIRFKYSGRDYILQGDEYDTYFSKNEVSKRLLFETDIMRGDTYGYQQYFIQCAYFEDNNEGKRFDTFKQKAYISEDVTDVGETLPLPASKYTEDDIKIITRYIDLNQCEYYIGNGSKDECDCKYNSSSTSAERFCMYQKYGYCPYRFQTEKHCRKIRTLNGSKSNRFNLTQELSKVFEIYPIYYIEHSKNGAIVKDDEGHPIKNIFYITEKGSENKLGFRYEKNLSNITKTVVSDQIVTKLYVEDNDSELSKTGLCSIKTAEDNPSKDNFIIDLSYYVKQGMLDKDRVTRDLYGIKNKTEGFLKQLGYYNTQYDQLSNSIINLQNESFGELESNINVSITGIESVLKEIAKLNKQMSRYEGNTEHNETYSNYEEKKKQQQSRLASLVKDLVDAEYPLSYINANSVEKIREDFEEKHAIKKGMLGQYNKEYEQIQIWKKQRAVYLKAINDLSAKFFKDYEAYLKEGTWTNSNYLTDNAYYHDAIQVAAEGAIPKVTYDITVVSLGILDENYNVDIADTSYVEDIGMFGINEKTGLPNKLKVLISELNESLDKPSEDSIKVQNFTTQFEDLFQQVTASVQSLTFNENIYKRSSNFTANQNIETESLQGTLDGNDLTYLNTDESNIVIDQNGQSGSNINNHNSKYKISGEGLFFSKNGGVSWDVGVGPEGINADYINTGTLDAGNIRIVDNDYIYFLWDKGGITAYRTPKIDKQNPGQDSEFGKYFARFNKYGLSLVENNQIRLRAGYEFWDNNNESEKGKIYNEDTEFYKEDGSETIARNIGFYLYDDSGIPIFKTETGDNSARLSLAGEILATDKLTEDDDSDASIGIFVNNQADDETDAPEGYSKRLFSILQKTDETASSKKYINILSVLEDGGLYIGSTAKAINLGMDNTDSLIGAGNFLDIDENDPNSIYFKDGEMFLGGVNFEKAIDARIDEIARKAEAKVLVRHAHSIDPTIEGIETNKEIEVNRMEFTCFEDSQIIPGEIGVDGYEISNLNNVLLKKPEMKNIFADLSNVYIGISNELWTPISLPGQPTRVNSINVNWIKLTDFIDILKLATTSTGSTGDNSGGSSGDVSKPGYYLSEPLSNNNVPENDRLNLTETINQNTVGLPTGCEVTSLSIALNYKNYNSEATLQDLVLKLAGANYLPQGNMTGDPRVTFVGSPSNSSSYGCFAECIIDTIKNYNNNIQYNNVSNYNFEELYACINNGNPILIWVTSNNLHKIEYIDSWVINDSRSSHNGENYTWPRYEHCVVMYGYDIPNNKIYVADPLSNSGFAEYPLDTFKLRYEQMGKFAIEIK